MCPKNFNSKKNPKIEKRSKMSRKFHPLVKTSFLRPSATLIQTQISQRRLDIMVNGRMCCQRLVQNIFSTETDEWFALVTRTAYHITYGPSTVSLSMKGVSGNRLTSNRRQKLPVQTCQLDAISLPRQSVQQYRHRRAVYYFRLTATSVQICKPTRTWQGLHYPTNKTN